MAFQIFQALYFVVIFTMFLMSLFIVYHIVAYAYSFKSKILMLAIFLPVVMVLMLTNYVMFFNIPWVQVFENYF